MAENRRSDKRIRIDGDNSGPIVQTDQLHIHLPESRPRSVPNRLILAAYQAQLIDMAPDVLQDRTAELDELARFACSDETYQWWQAAPWAGKSALLSWFALHPPAGVDVVSFFVTSRFVGQSDSNAFLEVVIEQLTVLAGEQHTTVEPRARPGRLLSLLRNAGQRCVDSGRRLVLVVDGLDEDTGKQAGVGLDSIASLLPRRVPAGVAVVLASRSNPALPIDVPPGHPLSTVVPRRLQPSQHARDLERAAKNELGRMLRGPALARDVLGLLTASGGGLTVRDLEELTGHPVYEVDDLLGGVLGRTVEGRTPTIDDDSTAERAYLFAHDTLLQIAVRQFGAGVTGFRSRIDAWAEDYRSRRWPPGTPAYLLHGYVRLLAADGDRVRLLTCATDDARHRRLREASGGDTLATTEVALMTDLSLRARPVDFDGLLRVAVVRDSFAVRTSRVAPDFPAVWVDLRRPRRAIALATGIAVPARRVEALRLLLRPLAGHGEHDLVAGVAQAARTAAAELLSPWHRREVFHDLAVELAGIDLQADARRMFDEAAALADQTDRPPVTHALAAAAMTAGNLDAAQQWIADSVDVADRLLGLSGVAAALADRGDVAKAAELAVEATALLGDLPDALDVADRVTLHAALAEAWAACGDLERADKWFTEAELAIVADDRMFVLRDPPEQLFRSAGRIMTGTRALRLLYRTRRGADLSCVFPIAKAIARAGNSRAAAQLVRRALRHHRSGVDPAWTLFDLASAAAGDPSASAMLDHLLIELDVPTWVRTPLIPLDEFDEQTAQSALDAAPGPGDRLAAAKAAAALAATGETTYATRLAHAAETLATTNNRRPSRIRTLTQLAQPLAVLGDATRVRQLADVIETEMDLAAQERPAPISQAQAFALSTAADPVQVAEIFGRPATDMVTIDRWDVFPHLASALRQVGDHRRADRLWVDQLDVLPSETSIAESFPDVGHLIAGRADLVVDLADAGADKLAARLFEAIAPLRRLMWLEPSTVKPLTALARAAYVVGERDQAEDLARTAEKVIHAGHPSAADNLGHLASTVAVHLDSAWAHSLLDKSEQYARRNDTRAQDSAFAQLAQDAVRIGDLARAIRLVDRISTGPNRDKPLAAIATATNEQAHADRLAGQITAPEVRARTYNHLARMAIDEGDHERATGWAVMAEEAIAELPQHIEGFNELRGSLAVTFAVLGSHHKARSIVSAIVAPEIRAHSLNRLITLPGNEKYINLVAEIFTTDHWRDALPVFAYVAPEALRAFCDEQVTGYQHPGR